MWRLYFDDDNASKVQEDAPTEEALRVIHKVIKKVTLDIEGLAFNTAISALHIATKELSGMGCTSKTVLTWLAQIMAPFAPHICEEIWRAALGNDTSITIASWPEFDDAYAVDNTVTIGVQILGKTRGQITISPDADQDTALAAAQNVEAIAKHLDGKNLVRVIYIPGRILNLIAK